MGTDCAYIPFGTIPYRDIVWPNFYSTLEFICETETKDREEKQNLLLLLEDL